MYLNVFFASEQYTLQEDVQPDGNKCVYCEPVSKQIYASPGHHKSYFCVNQCKRQKSVTLSTMTFDIPNIDVEVWNQNNDVP